MFVDNNSKTTGGRDSVTIYGAPLGNDTWATMTVYIPLSNGHVPDNGHVTLKGQSRVPDRLGSIGYILKSVRESGSVPKHSNGIWQIEL